MYIVSIQRKNVKIKFYEYWHINKDILYLKEEMKLRNSYVESYSKHSTIFF